jgi:parallel beta-helix repeat protein
MRRHLPGSVVLLSLIGVLALSSDVRLDRTESATIVVPDDFLAIQEAINNAVDGDTIFVKAGTYYEHVVVNKTVSLLGEDVSATIIDGNNTGHVVNVLSDNVSITGFTVQNSGSIHMPELDAGICLNGTAGCAISGNRLVDNGFAGISLLNSNQNTITCNNLSSVGWGGVHLMNSTRNLVSVNVIADKYGGVNGHVSSNYNDITENVISNCTYGMFYHASDHNNICGNNISAISVEGIWLQDQVNYNLVAENNLINNTVAIRLEGPNYNNTLSRNVITGAEYGIRIQNGARYTRMADNIIMDNRAGNDSWSAGIRLDSGSDSQIHSNTITGNNYGVLLYSYSPRVSIDNNTIADNEFGIRVASGGSDYLNVSNNFVMNNRGYGIGLTGFAGGSNNATITRNLIVNNSDGIALGQYSSYNTIIQNNISQNGYGFYIEYSTQNTIWANDIVDNDQQVYTSTGLANNWDSGYPAGGNYWSDYNGTDAFCGPNQDLPGSDGKGDTPYTIDENNQDNYPLMNPCRGLDVTPPQFANWTQNPIGEEIQPDVSVIVTIDVIDESGAKSVTLLYKQNSTGLWSGWIEVIMNHATRSTYEAIIPRFQGGTTVEYRMNGTDFFDNWGVTPDEGYSYTYHVIPEFSSPVLLVMLLLLTFAAITLKKNGASV